MHRARRAPAEGELCLQNVALELAIPESGSAILAGTARARDGAGRQSAVSTLRFGQRVVGVDVTDDHQHRVLRMVERAVELPDGVGGESAQLLLAPDAPASNAVLVVQQLVQ